MESSGRWRGSTDLLVMSTILYITGIESVESKVDSGVARVSSNSIMAPLWRRSLAETRCKLLTQIAPAAGLCNPAPSASCDAVVAQAAFRWAIGCLERTENGRRVADLALQSRRPAIPLSCAAFPTHRLLGPAQRTIVAFVSIRPEITKPITFHAEWSMRCKPNTISASGKRTHRQQATIVRSIRSYAN